VVIALKGMGAQVVFTLKKGAVRLLRGEWLFARIKIGEGLSREARNPSQEGHHNVSCDWPWRSREKK
jgi:hypothetical protein